MTTEQPRRTVADVFDDAVALEARRGEGVDGPTGPRACARVRVAATNGDDNWATAINVWDRIRALVRKLPAQRQAAAWQLVHDALTELRADLQQQFFEPTEEVI